MPSSYKIRFPTAKNDIVISEFGDEETKLLDKVVTNTDKRVFAWKLSEHLTPEEAGALLSRYSRTIHTGRQLYLKEFYPNRSRGKEFFEAWLVDYGDDSIQEMAGGIPMSCEYVSQVGVKEIEDSRFASYIEKSTRYVDFGKKLSDGSFMYYRDKDIMESRFADEYIQKMDDLFNSYTRYLEPMCKLLREKNPIEKMTFKKGEMNFTIDQITDPDEQTDIKNAYQNSIKANALDLLRDYLPMSTLTHVGISTNARSYENIIIKMGTSPLHESRELADDMQTELRKIVPTLTKRVNDSHGDAFREFIRKREELTTELTNEALYGIAPKQSDAVSIPDYTGKFLSNPDEYASIKVAAEIMFKKGKGHTKEQLFEIAAKNGHDWRSKLISDYVSERTNRRHRPGRAFEYVDYDFDLKGRIGIYRDLQRHRIGTQQRQDFSVSLGYQMRKEFEEIGIAEDYKEKMRGIVDLYNKLHEILPTQAQYVVTFGFEIRWDHKFSAREMYHVAELRTSPQGHPDYRKVVQEMIQKVRKLHPTLYHGMKFVNMEETYVGRLGSEIRMAAKRKALESKQ